MSPTNNTHPEGEKSISMRKLFQLKFQRDRNQQNTIEAKNKRNSIGSFYISLVLMTIFWILMCACIGTCMCGILKVYRDTSKSWENFCTLHRQTSNYINFQFRAFLLNPQIRCVPMRSKILCGLCSNLSLVIWFLGVFMEYAFVFPSTSLRERVCVWLLKLLWK